MAGKDLVTWLAQKAHQQYLRKRIVYAIDTVTALVCTIAPMVVTQVTTIAYTPGQWAILYSGAFVAILGSFYFLRTYRIIIRYSNLRDMWRIMLACLLKTICILTLILCLANGHLTWGTAMKALIDFLLTFFALVFVRMFMTLAYDASMATVKSDCKVILIYGVTQKSYALQIRLHNGNHFRVGGFLSTNGDADMSLGGSIIYRIGTRKDIDKLLANVAFDAVIFPLQQDVFAERDRFIPLLQEAKKNILMAPPVDEISNGKPLLSLHQISIEDLLGREEIQIDTHNIAQMVQDKVVFVSGAAGSIGSELCRQLALFGAKQLILYDNAETPVHNIRLELEEKFPHLHFVPIVGDVRHGTRLRSLFAQYKPQIVYHAAAYKHVPLMEENPCEAIRVNVDGTRTLADTAVAFGVEKFVMVSTDKAVNPTNVMGATKRLAEIYVQSLGLALANGTVQGTTQFITTRFGNVLGSNGSVIPLFKHQIAKGGPVTVTHKDINRFFMSIPEACRLVMQASYQSRGNEILVFEMGHPVKIVDLAERMIRLSGFTPYTEIPIEFTGLRKGEKLYEEVLSNAESTVPTAHPKIRVAKVRPEDYEQVRPQIMQITDLAFRLEAQEALRLLKELVPEYTPQRGEAEEGGLGAVNTQ